MDYHVGTSPAASGDRCEGILRDTCRGDRRVCVCILEEIRVGLITRCTDHLARVEGVALVGFVFLEHVIEFDHSLVQVYFDVAEGLPESGDLIVSLWDAGEDVRPSLADENLLLGVLGGNVRDYLGSNQAAANDEVPA